MPARRLEARNGARGCGQVRAVGDEKFASPRQDGQTSERASVCPAGRANLMANIIAISRPPGPAGQRARPWRRVAAPPARTRRRPFAPERDEISFIRWSLAAPGQHWATFGIIRKQTRALRASGQNGLNKTHIQPCRRSAERRALEMDAGGAKVGAQVCAS